MNLFVSDNLAAFRPDALPPVRRDGPARLLFLSSGVLGWKTSSGQLIEATQARDDVVACHVVTWPPLWMRVLNRQVPGARHHLVHPKDTWTWLLRRWLTGPLDARRFDAIHCNPQQIAGAPAALKSRFAYKLSMAADTTDVLFHRELSGLPGGEKTPKDRAIYAAADLILPLSTWCATSLEQDYGVDPEKLLITTPSAPIPAAGPAEVPPRGGRLLRIAFVGNDFVRKGGPRLLAWHQARWADRAELHVASAEAADYPPTKNVTWHGRLDHAGVMALLGRCDLLVHPTTADMSALVVAEAASCGVPAVASRIAGIPDLVDDGVSGVLISPGDDAGFIAAVESVLFDDTRLAAMSAAARRFAGEKLDSRVVYKRVIDRLVSLCDG